MSIGTDTVTVQLRFDSPKNLSEFMGLLREWLDDEKSPLRSYNARYDDEWRRWKIIEDKE